MVRLQVHLSLHHYRVLQAMQAERDPDATPDGFAGELLQNSISDYLRTRPSNPPKVAPAPKPKSVPYNSLRRSLGRTLAAIARFESGRAAARVSLRLRVIELLRSGLTVQQISQRTGTHPNTVRRWQRAAQ